MIEIRNHRIYADGQPVPFRKTPNTSGRTIRPEGIILHDTAGGLATEGSINWLTDPRAKASAHVVIARDGSMTQLAPLNIETWHAGKSSWQGRPNCNGFCIGIEIVNPGALKKTATNGYVNSLNVRIPADDTKLVVRQKKTPEHGSAYWLAYTEEQIEAVTELCRAIVAEYGCYFIATHWLISPGRKIDTNPLFPLESLRETVFGAAPVKMFGSADDESGGKEHGDYSVDPAFESGSPEPMQQDAEPARRWWKTAVKLIKSKTQWAASGISVTTIFGYLTDWKVLGVLGVVIVCLFALYIVYERSKKP